FRIRMGESGRAAPTAASILFGEDEGKCNRFSRLVNGPIPARIRSRHCAPHLPRLARLIAGFCSLWIKPTRLRRAAITLKPSTVLHFHCALVQRKYRLLFSPKRRVTPGPKGHDFNQLKLV